MYEFSSKSQPSQRFQLALLVVCDTANVRVFKQITTEVTQPTRRFPLFAILQMYEFSSKSQRCGACRFSSTSCLRYCKCTSFQANHNGNWHGLHLGTVVCDTAKVRFFKQITTPSLTVASITCCLRYCKCTSFQANND